MAKIYVLYNNTAHSFRSLKDLLPHAEIEFIFDKQTLPPTIEKCKEILCARLDKATPEDYLLLNGPSYVAACGGYAWFTRDYYDPETLSQNLIAYDTITKKYVLKEN